MHICQTLLTLLHLGYACSSSCKAVLLGLLQYGLHLLGLWVNDNRHSFPTCVYCIHCCGYCKTCSRIRKGFYKGSAVSCKLWGFCNCALQRFCKASARNLEGRIFGNLSLQIWLLLLLIEKGRHNLIQIPRLERQKRCAALFIPAYSLWPPLSEAAYRPVAPRANLAVPTGPEYI